MEKIKIQDAICKKYFRNDSWVNNVWVQEDLIFVTRTSDNEKRILDRTGKEIIPKDYLLHKNANMFSEGLIPVHNSKIFNGYGYMNTKGEIVIPCQFMEASYFSEGLAVVRCRNKDGKKQRYQYINKQGGIAFESSFIDAKSFSEGLAAVYNGFKYGYIDKTGKLVIDYKYKHAFPFKDGLAIVANLDDLQGVINSSGDEIIPLQYNWITAYENGIFIVQNQKDLYGAIDSKGKIIIPCQYKAIKPIFNGTEFIFNVSSDEGNYLINSKNEKLKSGNFYHIWDSEDGMIVVSNTVNGKTLFGVVDFNGEFIFPIVYKKAELTEGCIFLINTKNQSALFTKEGTPIIPFGNIEPSKFNDGIAVIEDKRVLINGRHGLYGYADKTGKTNLDFQYEEMSNFYKGYACVGKRENFELVYKLIDSQGNEKELPYRMVPKADINCVKNPLPGKNCLDFWDYTGNLLFSVSDAYVSLIQTPNKSILIESEDEKDFYRKKSEVLKKLQREVAMMMQRMIMDICKTQIEPLDLEAELVCDSDYTLSKRKKDEQ